jgi:NAD(P)-dependent dehydrogenase (short-subunit alcohol dehydrogenase family)
MTDRKICVITGATSGIGKATALALANLSTTLLLVSRKKEKGETVLREIIEETGNKNLELYLADLSFQADVRRLAEEIKARHRSIDVLINNAGGIFGKRILTPDGIELTFALNHLAYFMLTNLLIAQLKAAPAARVVNVSSQAHGYGTIAFDNLGLEKHYNAAKSYAQSKLANILFTHELSRLLRDTAISANALHPGAVRTNFGRELTGIAGLVFRHFGFLMRPPSKGAETVVWLSTAPQLNGVTGKYFCDKKEIRSSELSHDSMLARRLWEVSAKMTGLETSLIENKSTQQNRQQRMSRI